AVRSRASRSVPACATAGQPAQRHMLAPGDTTRRGSEGGDGAAAGARSSAWSRAGAAGDKKKIEERT
ncbi:unnamed protein product, partial [Urochloa humidicola]